MGPLGTFPREKKKEIKTAHTPGDPRGVGGYNSWLALRGNDHGSIDTQNCWFCCVKLMVVIQGGMSTEASKRKSVGFV